MGKIKEILFDIAEEIIDTYLDTENLYYEDEETLNDAIYGVIETYISDKEQSNNTLDNTKADIARNDIDSVIMFIKQQLDFEENSLNEDIDYRNVEFFPEELKIKIYLDYDEELEKIFNIENIEYDLIYDEEYGKEGSTTIQFFSKDDYLRASYIVKEISSTSDIDESLVEKNVNYVPNKNIIKIKKGFNKDYADILKKEDIKYTKFAEDNFISFKFEDESDYQKARKLVKEVKHINEEIDFDNYEREDNDYDEYASLSKEKDELQRDVKDINIAIDDLTDMENILATQIKQLRKIKRNSDATKLKNDIEKKAKELKLLKSEVKKAYNQINKEIEKNDLKIQKFETKASKK